MTLSPQHNPWGDAYQHFLALTPDKILGAAETSGVRCSGRILQLNSMENRVYRVELEDRDAGFETKFDQNRVIKFYRPGRWSKEQIEAEHQYLLDLKAADLPAVAPLVLENGSTLGKLDDLNIYFCVFPMVGGRVPDEFTDVQLEIVGRLLARMHTVGKQRSADARVRIDTHTYATQHLEFLLQNKAIPMDLESRYKAAVEEIVKISEPWFQAADYQRIHGDCHVGNLLWSETGPFWVDFDDMLVGPPVQDLWLLLPGIDAENKRQFNVLLNAYESMAEFDRDTLRLIEPLRAFRFIHFTTWIKKRYEDESFKRAFESFDTWSYWQEQVVDLEHQLTRIKSV